MTQMGGRGEEGRKNHKCDSSESIHQSNQEWRYQKQKQRLGRVDAVELQTMRKAVRRKRGI